MSERHAMCRIMSLIKNYGQEVATDHVPCYVHAWKACAAQRHRGHNR